ncbi:hypothetical protein GW17_00022669 [Ensete ventricosum]|nr:hypothetical protein GW17_00022669 [Ensete ventricosum]RZR98105.1 hypothetical protein BHM03_00027411 [Ensete ventricosum]
MYTAIAEEGSSITKLQQKIAVGSFLPQGSLLLRSRRVAVRSRYWQCWAAKDACCGDRLVVNGVESLCAAGRATTLVLRASWFSLSSCSRAKEMTALSVIWSQNLNLCEKSGYGWFTRWCRWCNHRKHLENKKTLATPKGHERLRAMAAMAMAATVMPDQR